MDLNLILFPAPKCRNPPNLLTGETIWIPKYKQDPLPTINVRRTQAVSQSLNCLDAPRSPLSPSLENIPHKTLAHKFSQPTIGKREEPVYHAHSKSVLNTISHLDKKSSVMNPSEKNETFRHFAVKTRNTEGKENVSSLANGPNGFIREKGQRNVLKCLERSFSFDSPTKKSEHQPEDISIDLAESPARTGPVFLAKKFTGSQFSNKTSKNSTATKDDLSNEIDRLSVNNNSNKPSFKNWEDCDLTIVDEDHEVNYDVDFLEEFPLKAATLTLPKNIMHYKLKTNEKTHLFNRTMTEVSPQSSETVFTTNKPIFKRDVFAPKKQEIIGHVPCLMIKSDIKTNKLLIYFHGNGEDIFLSHELLLHIRDSLHVHVLAMEYPGYGIYKGEPSEGKILEDAEAVYDYLTKHLHFNPQNIILFGRSIGSGPATWLASKKEVGALALMSAFTSIRAVVRDIAGKFLQYLIRERFNNLENIKQVKCPTFIVHGLKDTLIPYKHSQELHSACKSFCKLVLPRDMDHISFDFSGDFTRPLAEFLKLRNFKLEPSNTTLHFPTHLFKTPVEV